MKTAPDPSLKPVQFEIAYNQDNTPYPVILFNNGSIWRQCVENWHCVWPAPEHVRESNDSDLWGEQLAKMQSTGGKWHVMPGPVQVVTRNAEDVKRIAELEAEVKARKFESESARGHAGKAEARIKSWQDAASVRLVEDSDDAQVLYKTPDELVQRLKQLYRWASSAEERAKAAEQDAANERDSHRRTKANADVWCERACVAEAEVRAMKKAVKASEPLEPNRVIATAHKMLSETIAAPRPAQQKLHLFKMAAASIEALYGGNPPKLQPYQVGGSL